MNDLKVIFCLIMIIILSTLKSEEKFVIRFNEPDNEIVEEFTSEHYEVASYKPGIYLDLLVNNRIYEELINRGFDLEITQTETQLRQNMIAGRDLEGYRTYNDMLSELEQLEIDYPDLCKLYDIGDSRGKEYSDAGNQNYDDYYHDIWALKLSDNVTIEEDEPGVIYLGEHHGRETISLEMNMAIIYYLIDNYGEDPDITYNVNNTEIWFIPLVNPNGHKIVTDEDHIFWRKNIRDNDENGYITPATAYDNSPDGVDPNRNYGFQWGYVGTSSNCSRWNYNGPYAWSEPENQAVKELLDAHDFVAGITYHSYGEFICSPLGYSKSIITPDHVALEELMDGMASLTGYTAYAGIQLSPIMGLLEDYAYGTNGTFLYTIELATVWIPAANQVESICEQNIDAALLLLDRVNHSTLTGHITDADNGEPIQAEVFIEGIDDIGVYRAPYTSNEMYGTYYRLLTDGDYNVTFSAYGYSSQSFNNINIHGSGITLLDVSLVPETAQFEVTGFVTDAVNGLPIENAVVEIINCDIASVVTDPSGEYILADVYPYDFEFEVYTNDYFVFAEVINVSPNNNTVNIDLYSVNDESFENEELEEFWQFEGNTEWIIDDETAYAGMFSVRNGTCYSDHYSVLKTTLCLELDSVISFYYRVSSEYNYDFFRFQIDEILQDEWSGNISDWGFASYPVSAGMHTLEWSYIKDESVSVGSDCAWIDNISFLGSGVFVENNSISSKNELHSNYPNPFNPTTMINYSINNNSKISLNIYNIKGQKVKSLVDEIIESGYHTVTWNGKDDNNKSVSSGIYLYKLKTDNFEKTKKMILLK